MIQVAELYVHSVEKRPGQQWFEVVNVADEPINLKSVSIRRLDGQAREEAWKVILPDTDHWLEFGQRAVIAQRQDLGRNLCMDPNPVIAVNDKKFSFKSQGIQWLCLQLPGSDEHCVQINKSKKIEAGVSRNFNETDWTSSSCGLEPNFKATPALMANFCEQGDVASGWQQCPPPPESAEQVRQRKQLSGCAQTESSLPGLMGFVLLLLFVLRRLLKPKGRTLI